MGQAKQGRGRAKKVNTDDYLADVYRDPALFCERAFGITPTPQQAELFMAIKAGHRQIACRSGHGVGKTFALASLIIWMLATRRVAVIPCTAPVESQLTLQLWGTVRSLLLKAPEFVRRGIEVTQNQIRRVDNPSAYAVARVARKENPEALQGFHHEHLLVIVDEASGVDDVIFQPLSGMMTELDNRIILVGNPTRRSGKFYRVFTTEREGWQTFRWSSLDSPIVAKEYAADIARQYGEKSNVYRVRVTGDFPEQDTDCLIPLNFVEAAVGRHGEPIGDLRIGVDPARSVDGDATGLCARAGDVLLDATQFWTADEMQVVGRVVQYADAMALKINRPVSGIYVDTIGIGAGVHDRLREIGRPVVAVNVGWAAMKRQKPGQPLCNRLRDSLWWECRDWIRDGGCIPDNDVLIAELTSPKYGVNSSGKIVIEGKDDMSKRGLRSPNMADALCLTFFGHQISGSVFA